MIRRLLYIVPVVALAVIAGLLWVGLGRDPAVLPSTLIDRPLPAFELAPVRPADAEGLATDDFTGRPMLLNVFASWCVGCRVEHPFLMELEARGVVIQGLAWKDAPRCSSSIRKGCSTRQPTHQLAKTFRSMGRPVKSSVARPSASAGRTGSRSKAGSGRSISVEGRTAGSRPSPTHSRPAMTTSAATGTM